MANEGPSTNGAPRGVAKIRHWRIIARLRAAFRLLFFRWDRSRRPGLEPEARLVFVSDRVPAFIAQLDERERYVFVNRPYAGHYGRRPENVIGRHLRDVTGEQAYADLHPRLQTVLSEGRDAIWETSEGAKHFQFRATVARDEQDRARGVLIVGTDITKRKLTELELERAKRAAEAASRAKEDFLAVLSHELRTPLSAVYGWARILRAGRLDSDAVSRALDVIMRNAEAQQRLIDDLLDMSRIVSGKMRLEVRPVDLQVVIQAAIDAVRPAADAKEIRLECVLDPRATGMMGDPGRLQQIVWNLLINAVKFTPKRGRVEVRLQRTDSHVEIIVNDSGQGVSQEQLPRLFERFYQTGNASTRSYAGLGLGLALVRHLVELHGGKVAAQSPGVGQGATFTVELPVATSYREQQNEALGHSAAQAAPTSNVRPSVHGLRVLVVDDDRDSLVLVHTILADSGAEVRGCPSASEGLSVLRAWRPHVLISDIEMPGEDGYTLIQEVRAFDASKGSKTAAVALTAYGGAQDRARILAAGFDMHVSKPFDPAELITAVANLADRSSEP
jgi:PAS domain S-box-containing protein